MGPRPGGAPRFPVAPPDRTLHLDVVLKRHGRSKSLDTEESAPQKK